MEYWGECVLTAVLLINRISTPRLKNNTPFELLTSKQVDYTCIRVFGCLAYMFTSSKNRHNFQPRSEAGILLGYPFGYKIYRLLYLETNKLHISRNVTFHEDIFLFGEDKPVYPDEFISSGWMDIMSAKSPQNGSTETSTYDMKVNYTSAHVTTDT